MNKATGGRPLHLAVRAGLALSVLVGTIAGPVRRVFASDSGPGAAAYFCHWTPDAAPEPIDLEPSTSFDDGKKNDGDKKSNVKKPASNNDGGSKQNNNNQQARPAAKPNDDHGKLSQSNNQALAPKASAASKDREADCEDEVAGASQKQQNTDDGAKAKDDGRDHVRNHSKNVDGQSAGKLEHQGDHKVERCHSTGSASNPYVMVAVDQHAAQAHLKHHDGGDIEGDASAAECPELAGRSGARPDGQVVIVRHEKCGDLDNVIARLDTAGRQIKLVIVKHADCCNACPEIAGSASVRNDLVRVVIVKEEDCPQCAALVAGTTQTAALPANQVGGVIGFRPDTDNGLIKADIINPELGAFIDTAHFMTPAEAANALDTATQPEVGGAFGIVPLAESAPAQEAGIPGQAPADEVGGVLGATPAALPLAGEIPLAAQALLGLGGLIAGAGALLRRVRH